MVSDASHTYTDAENRLTQVDGGATATYAYDAYGRRVQKVAGGATTEYIYDQSGHVVDEANQSNVLQAAYVYLGDTLLAQYEYNLTLFIHKDHLGSTRVMTDLAGTIYDSMDYLPFGEQIVGGSTSTRKFTGKERDGETQLDNFEARYMSSSLGRFMSADDSKYINPADPQTFNLYSYVANNPLNAVDPTGHEPDASLAWAEHRYKRMQHGGSLDDSAGNVYGDGADSGTSVVDNSGPSGETVGVSCISCWYASNPTPTGDIADPSPSSDEPSVDQSSSPAPLQCTYDGAKIGPAGAGQVNDNPKTDGYYASVDFNFTASGGTGTYVWGDTQDVARSGSIITTVGIRSAALTKTESLDNHGSGANADFFDSPGLSKAYPDGGTIVAANVHWSLTLTAKVSSGGKTVTCSPVSWSVDLKWPKDGTPTIKANAGGQ
jgi:RHS repeat-associated protein